MTSYSSSELYVVVHYLSYSGISGDLDNLYTVKEEAQSQADFMSKGDPKFPSMRPLKYEVMTLDDYIDTVKSEARQDGRYAERESGSF